MKDVRVIISMMVLYNANIVTEYDRRRSGLPSAPLDGTWQQRIVEYPPEHTT